MVEAGGSEFCWGEMLIRPVGVRAYTGGYRYKGLGLAKAKAKALVEEM